MGDIERAVIQDIPMMEISQLKKLTEYVGKVKETLMTADRDYIIDKYFNKRTQSWDERQYTTRSGFAKLAQGFNLSDEILKEEELLKEDGSFKGFSFTVRVYNPYGRQTTGVGSCTADEPNLVKHKERPYHDCRSIAYTRAWNRAVSNFVGSAEVSAEEMSLGEDFDNPPEREGIKMPENFTIPDWDFSGTLGAEGWDNVDILLMKWVNDSGLVLVDTFHTPEVDAFRCWIRPKAYLGENFGTVSKMLDRAGFKWRPIESRWVLSKPEAF